MPQDDQLDTIIQDIIAGYPGPEAAPAARHQRPAEHRVIWFLRGLALFQVNAILLYLLAWLIWLRHG